MYVRAVNTVRVLYDTRYGLENASCTHTAVTVLHVYVCVQCDSERMYLLVLCIYVCVFGVVLMDK